MKLSKSIFLTAIVAVFVLSCTFDKDNTSASFGKNSIQFGASTSYKNGVGTKTEYSGKNFDVSGSTYERINWLDSDKVRVLCKQASLVSGSGYFADYDIKPDKNSNQISYANMLPSAGNGLQWSSNTPFPAHYFYALYPSTATLPSSKIADYGTNQAQISGTVPKNQSATKSASFATDCRYMPNMNYAYMYAATKVASKPSSNTISLDFRPLVNAFEFIVSTPPTDAITEKLISLTLTSAQTSSFLTGDFTATLSLDNSVVLAPLTASDIQNGGNSISVDIPDGGVQLSTAKENAIRLILLALPMSHTDLTVKMEFASNGGGTFTRSLELKKSGGFVTVDAGKKMNIKLEVPKTTTDIGFDVTYSVSLIPYAGGSDYVTVTSYKTNYKETCGLAWSAEFSEDYGVTWKSSKPDWVTDFTTSGSGSDSGERFIFTLAENTTSSWDGKYEVGNKANPRDLSCYDIYGTKTGGTEGSAPYNTANCYVVSAPGWYRIPCVYGNAISRGAPNSSAYTSAYEGTYSLKNFINHAGQNITSPWIADNNTQDGNTKINVDGASLVWQDVRGIISEVEHVQYNGKDYIRFCVDKASAKNGNAVIAAMSGSTVVWSWQLWFVDAPAEKLAKVPVYSSTEPEYKSVKDPNFMLSSALGIADGGRIYPRQVLVKFKQAVTGTEKQIAIIQDGSLSGGSSITHYQWGRKDPMPPLQLGSGVESTIYDINGESVSLQKVAYASSYQLSIQNPKTFYKISSGSWFNTRYYNLWNSSLGVLGADEAVAKTVYDPCPPGFKVPNKHAFTGFTNSPSERVSGDGINAMNKEIGDGYFFFLDQSQKEVIFLSKTGRRGHTSGNIQDQGHGKYWTAAYSDDGLYIFFLNCEPTSVRTLHVNPSFGNASAQAIMPVAE